jgi:O-antigen ligase
MRVALAWSALALGCIGFGGLLTSGSAYVPYAAGGGILMFLLALLWSQRPDVVLVGFVFAVPLMKNTSATGLANPDRVGTMAILACGFFSILERPRLSQQMRLITRGLVVVAATGLLAAMANHATAMNNVAKLLFKPLSWGAIIWLVALHLNGEEKALRLLRTMIYSAGAVAAVAIWQKLTGTMVASYYERVPRATGTFETWNELGGYMALMILPTIAYAIECRRRVFLLIAGAEIVALLLSQTLGAMIAIVVSGVFLLPRRRISLGTRLALVCVPILGALVLSVAAPGALAKVNQAGSRTQDRLATYVAGWHVARHHLMFGLGSVQADQMQLETGAGSTRFGYTTSVPHNAFLSTLVERGVIGALALLYVAWVAFRILLAAGRTGRLVEAGLMLGGIAFLIQSNTNNLLNNERLGVLFLILVVVADRLVATRSAGRSIAIDSAV